MTPRLRLGLLVLAVFAALAVLSATGSYLSDQGVATPPPARVKGFSDMLLGAFRYYLAWAVVTPGILWLGRRVPFTRQRWRGPLVFHALVPAVASGPFFVLTVSLGLLFGRGLPPFGYLVSIMWRVVPLETVALTPVYWLVIGAGAALQFHRDARAKQLQAIDLQRSLASAQLDALRMKLQPHFLFNTLSTISFLAQADDTEAVWQVVERLGTMLRLSMETGGRQFVTLEEELALLDEYLAIEEIRFKDRLRVVRRVDPAARNALVPNLILQPLVQNAIAHGFSRRLDAGLLEIGARRDDGVLSITVRDDGPGLPPGWRVDAGARRGIRNVVERLQALYPGSGRFDLDNDPAGGAIARLRLPFAEAGAPSAGSADHGQSDDDYR